MGLKFEMKRYNVANSSLSISVFSSMTSKIIPMRTIKVTRSFSWREI